MSVTTSKNPGPSARRRARGKGQIDVAAAGVAVPSADSAPVPARVAYLTQAELAALRRGGHSRILGEVHFGDAVPGATGSQPRLAIDMPQLGGARVEVWLSELPVVNATAGDIRFAYNDEVLFGCVAHEIATQDAAFETAVYATYRDILQLVETRGYPHLLRVWNYFSDINSQRDGLDSYQRFCRGRFRAFEERYSEFFSRLPAASAVGARSGGLRVYFLAAKTPGRHRENPRQMSAYHYPLQYGPRSPSFARATLKRWGGRGVLYISGTASITGHESRHLGDFGAQLEEAVRNVEVLIQSTAADEGVGYHGLADLGVMKVYLRDPAHFGAVQAQFEKTVGAGVPVLYLQGDICRADLLVEVEGIAEASI